MKFRTEIIPAPAQFKIGIDTHLISLGSCFAETVAAKLAAHNFNIAINPTGILFNPESIAALLNRMINDQPFIDDDLFEHDGEWKSFSHHSRYSGVNKSAVLSNMNTSLINAKSKLSDNSILMITFGTAFVFRDISIGKVVANCHKVPASQFTREKLSVEDIVDRWESLIIKLKTVYPDIKMIFSISPVRHLRDDATENSLSKAILRCAVEKLKDRFDFVHYFPAFELMTDDLRDYRFYADDMVHPSTGAIEYVFEAFSKSCLDVRSQEFMERYKSIISAKHHELRSENKAAVNKFISSQIALVNSLAKDFPEVNLDDDLRLFNQMLEPMS